MVHIALERRVILIRPKRIMGEVVTFHLEHILVHNTLPMNKCIGPYMDPVLSRADRRYSS